MPTMDEEWYRTFRMANRYGREISPRGWKIRELDHHTITVDMNYPVLRCTERKLNYRFMAAEAQWIIMARSDVAFLTKYNPNMQAFSDDGVTLAGAYGPRIMTQMSYVVQKLFEDRDTRQATLTIWKPNPPTTKDYPCTIAMDFKIRDDRLNLHVFMRSSDIWLGLPYDVFSFTAVATRFAQFYNDIREHHSPAQAPITPGNLYLTAASSHLYQRHWGEDIGEPPSMQTLGEPLPLAFLSQPVTYLGNLMNSDKSSILRWWK